MKKTALIFCGLLMAILSSGKDWDCDPTKQPTSVTNFNVSTIVKDNKGQPAINGVTFWEDKEFVVDIFVLATDSGDNKTHLYVHELFPLTNEDGGWQDLNQSGKLHSSEK